MKVLSIDVGIKNLALCLFEKDNYNYESSSSAVDSSYHIRTWDVVNLTTDDDTAKLACVCSGCKKPVKFRKNNTWYCQTHAKQHPTCRVPTTEERMPALRKHTVATLRTMATERNLLLTTNDNTHSHSHSHTHSPTPKQMTKPQLVTLLEAYIRDHCLQPIETKRAKDVNLFALGQCLKRKLDILFANVDTIDCILIENQIGPLAIRMTTLQGMLVQYFVSSTVHVGTVEFVSAANKLAGVATSSYRDRKKTGIAKCEETLQTHETLRDWLPFFQSHKKKDDLSDAFLQGVWYMDNHTQTH